MQLPSVHQWPESGFKTPFLTNVPMSGLEKVWDEPGAPYYLRKQRMLIKKEQFKKT